MEEIKEEDEDEATASDTTRTSITACSADIYWSIAISILDVIALLMASFLAVYSFHQLGMPIIMPS